MFQEKSEEQKVRLFTQLEMQEAKEKKEEGDAKQGDAKQGDPFAERDLVEDVKQA